MIFMLTYALKVEPRVGGKKEVVVGVKKLLAVSVMKGEKKNFCAKVGKTVRKGKKTF